MAELNDEQVEDWKRKIDAMSHGGMARLYRFSASGHPCFITGTPVTKHFTEKWTRLGGFNPALSKKIGW